jgi:hypothetical protein
VLLVRIPCLDRIHSEVRVDIPHAANLTTFLRKGGESAARLFKPVTENALGRTRRLSGTSWYCIGVNLYNGSDFTVNTLNEFFSQSKEKLVERVSKSRKENKENKAPNLIDSSQLVDNQIEKQGSEPGGSTEATHDQSKSSQRIRRTLSVKLKSGLSTVKQSVVSECNLGPSRDEHKAFPASTEDSLALNRAEDFSHSPLKVHIETDTVRL